MQSAHVVAELWIGQLTSQRCDVFGGQPRDAGQVGPLVVIGFKGGRVEKDCGAVLAALAVERCGDEIAQPAAGMHVLRWE